MGIPIVPVLQVQSTGKLGGESVTQAKLAQCTGKTYAVSSSSLLT